MRPVKAALKKPALNGQTTVSSRARSADKAADKAVDKVGLAVCALCLALHVFHNNIVNFAQRTAVFQHLPGGVGVVVYANQPFVADD